MPSAISPSPFHLELLTTRAGFDSLRGEWDALLARSGANGIFLSWSYLETWLGTWGAKARLAVVTARDDDGRLRGIAPMAVMPGVSGARKVLRHLTFLGALAESLAEFGDYIIEEGLEEELAPAFTRLLLTHPALRWDLLCLKLARAVSPAMLAMKAELPRFGQPVATEQCAWVCALAGTWEAQLAGYSSRIRQMIRSRERALLKEFPAAALHHAGTDVTFEEALEVLVELNRQRWGGEGTAFHTGRFVEFHRALVPRLAAEGRVSFTLLQVDGKYVAARYDFIYANRVLNFQSGWDPAWADHSVSIVLLAMTVRHFLERGFAEYDFMAGDTRYKREWSTRTEPLLNVEMANPRSLRARAFFGVRKLKALADSLRSKPAAQPAPAAA
jgi:CelD/BcsL family acetyltransferase involved in cellulose biosynthesis